MLKLPKVCCPGRHSFGKGSRCSPYLLQEVSPSFSSKKKKKKNNNKKSQALCQLPPKYSRKVSLLPVLHDGHGGSKKLINLLNVTLQVRGEVRIQMQVLISMILASLMPFCFHRVLLLSCHLLIRKYLTRIRRTKKCDR